MKKQQLTAETALMIELGGLTVPLEDIAQEYLGISPAVAVRRANAMLKGSDAVEHLPIVAFKLTDSNKAPWLVRTADLAKLINDRYLEAKSVFAEA